MDRALPCIRIATALAAVAIATAGCTAANNATSSQASSQGEQPYKTMYGLSSDGPTTDLYTEFFGPQQAPPTATPAVANAEPQPVTAQPIAPGQGTAASTRPARPGQAVSAANRTPQTVPQQSPVQVAQQPAPAPAPQEPDIPTVYGITAKGPTTDLYTALFGRRDSQ